MGDEKDNKKTEFKVKLGDIVQLQFIPEDNRERLNAKVIGHSPNKSLIITAPRSGGNIPILRESQYFVVRMLQGNKVYGFESSVLKYYTMPYPHVHLTHPSDVECIVVRASRRVQTQHVVSVLRDDAKDEDEPMSANMLNTSVTGALIQTETPIGELDDVLQISVDLTVHNIQRYIRIAGIIRNVSTPEDRQDQVADTDEKSKDDYYRYGVEFYDVDEDDQLVLHGYVYEQIVKLLED